MARREPAGGAAQDSRRQDASRPAARRKTADGRAQAGRLRGASQINAVDGVAMDVYNSTATIVISAIVEMIGYSAIAVTARTAGAVPDRGSSRCNPHKSAIFSNSS